MTTQHDKAKRWRPWQFSLRTLLWIFVVVASFCVGWMSNEWKRAREPERVKPDQLTILIPLQFLNPKEVEAPVSLLLSQHGRVQAISSRNSIFVIDTREAIERIRRFLRELDSSELYLFY